MSYRISKEFAFSASHVLDGLPEGHQCARLHGHNYIIVAELTSLTIDDTGFVLDYGELSPLKRYIDDVLDHRHLNDVLEFNPTAERMAEFLVRRISEVISIPPHVKVSVGVSETPKTWAWYSSD